MGRPRETYPAAVEVDAVSGAVFAMRRTLFAALGGFDSSFFLYMEDTDLSLRARLAGYRCFYTPASVVARDYRLRVGPQKMYYQERNRYLMLLKTLRWRSLAALLPALLLAELLAWGFVLLRDRANAANKLRAYHWVAHNWRAIMQSRQHTQAGRRCSDRALLASCAYQLDFRQTGAGGAALLAAALFNPLFALARAGALAMVH